MTINFLTCDKWTFFKRQTRSKCFTNMVIDWHGFWLTKILIHGPLQTYAFNTHRPWHEWTLAHMVYDKHRTLTPKGLQYEGMILYVHHQTKQNISPKKELNVQLSKQVNQCFNHFIISTSRNLHFTTLYIFPDWLTVFHSAHITNCVERWFILTAVFIIKS
jgi:hypothetical protein